MRSLLFFILLSFVPVTFSFSLQLNYAFPSFGESIVETHDSTGFIFTGMIRESEGYFLSAGRIDNEGNILWIEKYGMLYNSDGVQIIKTRDGNYICCGTIYIEFEYDWDFYLVKIDGNGEIIWENSYGGENRIDEGWQVTEAPNGGFLQCGRGDVFVTDTSISDWRALVIRTDSLGNELWSDFLFDYSPSSAIRCEAMQDTTFLVLAFKDFSSDDSFYLVQYNDSGEKIRTINMGATNYRGLDKFENYYLLSQGGEPVTVLDSTLEMITIIDTMFFSSAFFMNDSTIAVFGSWDSVSFDSVYLSIFDIEGNLIRTNRTNLTFCEGMNTSDDDFIFIGYTPYLNDIWITKTDSFGNIDNTYDIDLKRGWNMVSYPYDSTWRTADFLPGVSYRYIYDYHPETGYYDVRWDDVENGVGLFALSEHDTTVTIDGRRRLAFLDVMLYRGWNMIGGPGLPVIASDLYEKYPEIVPPIYYFVPDSGVYFPADTIEPTKAYWIMSSEDSLQVELRE